MPKTRETERSIVAALRIAPFAEPAHVVLTNVRNKVGFGGGGRERFADAVVLSVFPSRGLWIAGVEVKVSRSDWKRELEDPEKSTGIQRYCDYWWLATAPGIVQEGELPETWGLIEAADGKAKVKAPAPKLEKEPLGLPFVASILRNAYRSAEKVRETAEAEGYARGVEEERARAGKVAEAEARPAGWFEREVDRLNADIRAFDMALGGVMGVRVHGFSNATNLTKRRVQDFERVVRGVQHIEGGSAALRDAAEALKAIEAATNISRHERTEGAAVPQVQETHDG